LGSLPDTDGVLAPHRHYFKKSLQNKERKRWYSLIVAVAKGAISLGGRVRAAAHDPTLSDRHHFGQLARPHILNMLTHPYHSPVLDVRPLLLGLGGIRVVTIQ